VNVSVSVPFGMNSPLLPRLEAVMTDNTSEFRSAEFEAAVAKARARHLFIHAGRPQTNGCVERVQRTVLDECWKPEFARYLIPKYTGLRLDLDRYLRYDNTDRAHTGRWTRGRTPPGGAREGQDVVTLDATCRQISGTAQPSEHACHGAGVVQCPRTD